MSNMAHAVKMTQEQWDEEKRQMSEARDHEPRAVKVDDLIIDEDTGEVLELPENAGDLVEFLTYRERQLKDGEDAYIQARVLVKLALKRELEKLDLRSLQTQYGRPTIRSHTTRKGKVERAEQVVDEFELSPSQAILIFSSAASFDAKNLDALSDKGLLPREAIEALIEETTSEWLQVNPVLKPPPVVEKIHGSD